MNNLIVIIDDEPSVLDVLKAMVESLGYKTECFYCVKDSLICIKDNVVNLILLDYSIPGENSLDNIKEILSLDSNLKIILLSGYDTAQIKEYENMGIYDFLHKPVKLEKLSDAIKSALNDTS